MLDHIAAGKQSRSSIISRAALEPVVRLLTGAYAMTALDVGCRRELCPDLRALGALVDVVGFDADTEAAQAMDEANRGWRSVRVLSAALGREMETVPLHLTRERGCSSLLAPDLPLLEAFSRSERYHEDKRISVTTRSLDRIAKDEGLDKARYMKIDVQGWEQAVFEGAGALLSNALVAIRTEISFRQTYQKQPLFSDIDNCLRGLGFVPVGFMELHTWRRSLPLKLPQLAPGDRPYSQGELIHGDMLYLRDPAELTKSNDKPIDAAIAAGLIGLCYGLVDYTAAIWQAPTVAKPLYSDFGVDPDLVLTQISKRLARRYRLRLLKDAWIALRRAVRGR